MEAEMPNLECFEEELCTPMKTGPSVLTPRQSDRKRALFPSASPQSSDLGPMSPLYSSPENSPKVLNDTSPNPIRRMSKSPFAGPIRAALMPSPIRRESPRKLFAQIGLLTPMQQAAQTDIGSRKEEGKEMTPQRTPVVTPQESRCTKSEIKPSQPMTPSKKRSKSLGAADTSGSPGLPGRFSLDSRSRSSDSPKARTSLFSDGSRAKASKRQYHDDVYLTGRSAKRQRVYGEINKGVRTGIKRPIKKKTPPSKPPRKPVASKVKSVWEVGPSSKKKKNDPLLEFSIFPMFSSKKTKEVIQPSQSASGHLLDISRGAKRRSAPEEVPVEEREPSPEPDPKKRFFKTNRTMEINRKATVTVTKGVKLFVSNGNFFLDSNKKRRKLFNHTQEAVFEDDPDDPVLNKSRENVATILKKLEKEDEPSQDTTLAANPINTAHQPVSLPKRPPLLPTARDHSPPRRFPEMSSPLLSPLSALASSTSTLSLNLHKDTPRERTSTETALPTVLMEEDEVPKENTPAKPKLFPIFNRETQLSDVTNTPERSEKKVSWKPIGDDQYQIDAGQKRFGATECGQCGLVYQLGDPEDEIRHEQFHSKILPHSGWKNERIVTQVEHGYISLVLPSDCKAWWDRITQVLKIVDNELGFADIGIRNPKSTQVYLYIFKKQIVGCLLAESVSTAYRMLLSEEESGVDCCSEEEYPVVCGISRLWVHRLHRSRGIASQLVECMRRYFALGKTLSIDDFAFSSPTVDGKRFAAKYTKKSDYLVYM